MVYVIRDDKNLLFNILEDYSYNKISTQYENICVYDEEDYFKDIKEVIRFGVDMCPYKSKPYTNTYTIIMDEFKREEK